MTNFDPTNFDPPTDPYGSYRQCRICDGELIKNSLTKEWECLADHEKVLVYAIPVLTLTCSCCDGETTGRQWYNRDTGYGICGECVVKIAKTHSQRQLQECYGDAGYHYFLPVKVSKNE